LRQKIKRMTWHWAYVAKATAA